MLKPPGPNRTAAQKSTGSRKANCVPGSLSAAMRSNAGPNATMPTASGATARRAPSRRRNGAAFLIHGSSRVTAITMAGTSMSSVSVFEKNRVRHTSQYGSALNRETTAASANEDRNGAASTAYITKIATSRNVSNRRPSPNRRTAPAASSASVQFVTNNASTRAVGRPTPNCTMRCAGRAARR